MNQPHRKPDFDIQQLRLSCRECSVHELCLPSSLRGDDLIRLSDLVGHSSYDPGQHIFNTGDVFQALYVVQSGSVKTSVTTRDGGLQILHFHLPGELIGLDGLAEHHHQCTAEPLEPSQVCRLPYRKIEQLANDIPALQKQLLRIVSREFFLDHQHILMMGGRPAIQRLALFIQTLSHRKRLLHEDHRNLTLSMSRVELANYLALATETVSRLLARLQRLGVLRLERHNLEIVDMERLVEISGDDLELVPYPH